MDVGFPMNIAEMMQYPQDWNRDRYHDMQTTLDAPCPLLCAHCHGEQEQCAHPDTPTWADVINAGIGALT